MELMKIKPITKVRRGQVFLLLALVILLYLLILSTTVYQISQTPYIQPAPNQEQLLNNIDNAISSLYDLGNIALSSYSQGKSIVEIREIITDGIVVIEDYLLRNGLFSLISYDTDSLVVSNSTSTINPVLTTFQCTFNLLIENQNIYFSTIVDVDLRYYLQISGTTGSVNYITIYKLENDIQTFLANCVVTITPSTSVSNQGDGRYQANLEEGQTIQAILPHNIYLWKII